MKLFVGLGNPGRKYDRNRHNVGFMTVDAILRAHNFGPSRARFQSECFEGLLGHEKILVLKPTTYMNESGRAVGEAVRFFKLDVSDVVVFHDELDLAAAKVRVKTGGGHAGNNGIRSIASHIGPDFMRVRIGIGHPGEKSRVHSHVLSDFAKSDDAWLTPLLDAMADNAELLAKGDAPSFQNKIHLSLAPKKEATKTPAEKTAATGKKAKSGNAPAKTENKD